MPGEAVRDAEVIVVEARPTPSEAWAGVRDVLADEGYRRGFTVGQGRREFDEDFVPTEP